jgi:hypothetical protein
MADPKKPGPLFFCGAKIPTTPLVGVLDFDAGFSANKLTNFPKK